MRSYHRHVTRQTYILLFLEFFFCIYFRTFSLLYLQITCKNTQLYHSFNS